MISDISDSNHYLLEPKRISKRFNVVFFLSKIIPISIRVSPRPNDRVRIILSRVFRLTFRTYVFLRHVLKHLILKYFISTGQTNIFKTVYAI